MARLAIAVLLLNIAVASGQPPSLEDAYTALKVQDYARAIAGFERAIAQQPSAQVHKDLAYTLLKTGENEKARDHFAEALLLDPADDKAALEYAFLCYETRKPAEARRVFARLRNSARDPADRATATQAFDNIDRPLAESIDRWQRALSLDPLNFSAHEELAHTAEQRDELALALDHYRAAARLRPQRTDLSLDIARVLKSMGRDAEAQAALSDATRSSDPRVSETARDRLPSFDVAVRAAPVPSSPASATTPRDMAARSLDKGYLQDAVKYLWAVHQADPGDFEVMLDLGRAYNSLKDDQDALKWFDQARRSPDPAIAAAASTAFHNIAPALERFRTTVWAYPMFSSRWHDTFAYAQVKTELRLPGWIVHPYVSLRFIGDIRGTTRSGATVSPLNLSENSAIVGVGLATNYWHSAMGWFEAGESIRYRSTAADLASHPARAIPDYRGGLSFAKGFGHLLSSGSHGAYAESSLDAVYVSRFSRDTIFYSQNRTGYTLPSAENFLGFHVQIYWNWNASGDVKRLYWTDTVESGPGIRFRFEGLPAGLRFSMDALHGAYLVNAGNPRRPNFNDLRIGIWYALTR